MGELEQVLQHHQRIGAALVERGRADRAPPPPRRAARFRADRTPGRDRRCPSMSRTAASATVPPRKRDRLVEQRQPVAHRAVGGARDQRHGRGLGLDPFGRGDPAVMRDQQLDRHAAQRKALAARQHGHRHLVDLGRGEDELDVGRRLFERLQQRVEGVLRQHVHFVDDVDLVARRDRPVAHAVGQLADVVDAGARGRVHLDHVDMAVLGDGAAVARTAPHGLDRRPARAVGADAVERAGDDARGRRLADAAHAGEDEGMGDPPGGDRVRERAHHRLLPDQLGEAAAAGICGRARDRRCAGSLMAPSSAQRARVGDRTTTQAETRYGCFLPDLTGLARDLSAASLPRHYISLPRRQGKPRR